MNSHGKPAVLASLFLLGLAASLPEAQASGPAVAQQSVAQVQSALTDASLGWHRWGYGWGGWGYGGFGWGGWGHRGFGWGGYPWGGYGGYGYVSPIIYTSPVIYTYPVVRVRPRYYYGCSYAVPYQSTSCCDNTYVAPSYNVTSYSYPSQPSTYVSSTYTPLSTAVAANPARSSRVTTARQTDSFYARNQPETAVYVPSSQIYTPTNSTSSTLARRTEGSSRSSTVSSIAPSAAPYPAPPVEYAKPVSNRGPIANNVKESGIEVVSETTVAARPKATAGARTSDTVAARPNVVLVSSPYSTGLASTGVAHAAFAPITEFRYSPSATIASRMTYGLGW